MLKYKFEKYILLVARIKKNKIFNLALRVTFTGHEFIFILPLFLEILALRQLQPFEPP